MLLGGQNQTWGAVWVWRQPLVSGQLTGIQGDALKRGKQKGRSLPLSVCPLRATLSGLLTLFGCRHPQHKTKSVPLGITAVQLLSEKHLGMQVTE